MLLFLVFGFFFSSVVRFWVCFSLLNYIFSNFSATKYNDADSDYAPDALNAVRKKLLDSLESLELGDKLGNRVLEPEGYYTKRPLSLNAIADGPRLRLLCASLQRVEEEVSLPPLSCFAMVTLLYFVFFPFRF